MTEEEREVIRKLHQQEVELTRQQSQVTKAVRAGHLAETAAIGHLTAAAEELTAAVAQLAEMHRHFGTAIDNIAQQEGAREQILLSIKDLLDLQHD